MKRFIIGACIVVAIGIAVSFLDVRRDMEDSKTVSASSTITFPQGGEELKQGEVYVLSWTGGPDPIQIFLIDRSLKGEGASVAVSDRVYGVKNEHTYSYRIPETVKPGEYEFQIGSETSNSFNIVPR
jgi:hypothetical protein